MVWLPTMNMPRIPPHSILPVLSLPAEILRPSECWTDKPAHDATATKLAGIQQKFWDLRRNRARPG
jgi:hypothetical protein